MRRQILLAISVVAVLCLGSQTFAQSKKELDEAVTISANIITLKNKDYRFRQVTPGRVVVTDIIGSAKAEFECYCDPDSSGSCSFYIEKDKIRCDGQCGDCDVRQTSFKGDDKLQTESPSGGGAPVYRPESGGTEDTKKWTITPNPQVKGLTGRLVVDLPVGTTYVVQVYKSGTNERSISEHAMKSASLLPGLYDVLMNTGSSDAARRWRLTGVPIESGKDTRMHAGVLNVTVNGAWQVYDEARQVVVVSGYGVSKIGLLAGRYQVKLANDFMPILIRDGQVTDL